MPLPIIVDLFNHFLGDIDQWIIKTIYTKRIDWYSISSNSFISESSFVY
jgi:hypothetical protein